MNPVSAALILADKTDVRRNRVRNQVKAAFDKHDRVNYAAVSSSLKIDRRNRLSVWKLNWMKASVPLWIILRYFFSAC